MERIFKFNLETFKSVSTVRHGESPKGSVDEVRFVGGEKWDALPGKTLDSKNAEARRGGKHSLSTHIKSTRSLSSVAGHHEARSG